MGTFFNFLCMLPDYLKQPGPIKEIIFFVEKIYFPGGPIVITSGSDDGILEKAKELFKF